MKKILFLFSAVFFASFLSFAQAPQGINYQGVARDNSGAAVSNQNISVKFQLHQSSTSGSVVFTETHTVLTDTFGLYSLVIGTNGGSPPLSSVLWANGPFFMQVDIDAGTGYNTVANVQLMSVPYALYAGSAGNSGNGTVTSITSGAGLTSTPNPIIGAGTIDLPIFSAGTNTYGSSSSYPVITVDQYGRVISAATQTVTTGNVVVPGTGLTATTAGNTTTLTAMNASPIWNAGALVNIPVSTTTPLTNDVLQYNGTQWTPSPLPSGLPAGSNGQLLIHQGGNWVGSNLNNLSFVGGNLGIGTSSPTTLLESVSTSAVAPIKATNTSGLGPAIISNGPLQLNGAVIDGAAITGTGGEVLVSQGPGSAPKWLTPGSMGPWQTSGANIFTGAGFTNVGIGTNSPNASLDISNTVGGTNHAINIFNNGSGYGINVQNSANSSSGLKIYHPANGSAAYISAQGGGSVNSDALYVETNGGAGANAIKGYSSTAAGGIIGWNDNQSGSGNGAGIYGYSTGPTGYAGVFNIQSSSNAGEALKVTTNGTGFSGTFSGGSGLQTDKIQITSGGPVAGYVLTSFDALGNAVWSPAGGLPSGSLGQVLYHDGTKWLGSPAAGMYFNGTQLGIGTSTPSAAIDAQGGASTAGNFVSSGNAAAINAQNSGTGTAINAINSGTGSVGTFQNTNAGNVQPVLNVINSVGSSGKSAIFSGGSGVQIDNLQVQTNLNIPLNANNGWVLTSGPTGDASWQAPAGGVATVGTGPGIVNSGTPTNPILGLLASGITAGTYGTASSYPTFIVDTYGRLTNAGTFTYNILPNGSTGQMLFNNTGTWTASNTSNLIFTGSNLGIGNPAPTSALDVATSGTNVVGNFKNTNASNANNTLASTTNGSGSAVIGTNTGTGRAAFFEINTNNANSSDVLYATTFGTGKAGYFEINNAGNTQPAVSVSTNGGGAALFSSTSGTSPAVIGSTTGTSNAGFFQVNNAANTNVALAVSTNGTGSAGTFSSSNAGNNATALNVSTAGGGFSGSFSGGKGLQTDKAQITIGAAPGAVLVSSNSNGDAIWAGGVNFAAEGGATSTANNGATLITFGTLNYSNPGGLLAGNNTFTAPVNGLYHFDCGVSINIATPITGAQDFVVRLAVGGGTYREASVHLPNGFAGVVQNVLSADAQLASGQTVTVVVFQTLGQSATVTGGAQAKQTFFNGHIVH